VLYTQPPPPKKPRPLLHARALKRILKKRIQKNKKKTSAPSVQAAACGPWATAGRRPLQAVVALPATTSRRVAGRPLTDHRSPGQGRSIVGDQLVGKRLAAANQQSPTAPAWVPLFCIPPTSCPQNFAHEVNSSSLALAYARLA
jgi:hypothetical protein